MHRHDRDVEAEEDREVPERRTQPLHWDGYRLVHHVVESDDLSTDGAAGEDPVLLDVVEYFGAQTGVVHVVRTHQRRVVVFVGQRLQADATLHPTSLQT